MLVPTLLVAVYFASSTVANSVFDKPYYDVEDAENLFREYVKEYGKKYNRREYFERLEIFKESLQEINIRNEKYPMTLFKVNHFADLKPEELLKNRGLKLPSNETVEKVRIPVSPGDAPSEFDWRKHHAVTHVRQLGSCDSEHIFSAIGNIEGQYAIKHKKCLALSDGQALDCLKCGTCRGGGRMETVMNEFSKKKGIMKEEDYPFTPQKLACHEDESKVVVKVIKGQQLDVLDEDTLAKTLVDVGPLSIGINRGDLSHYSGGILEPETCKNDIDYAVLLVGYGEENGKKFWIIKNSYGPSWGELGYLRLRRGVKACGIGLYTVTATVA